jgi:hypothetical protein
MTDQINPDSYRNIYGEFHWASKANHEAIQQRAVLEWNGREWAVHYEGREQVTTPIRDGKATKVTVEPRGKFHGSYTNNYDEAVEEFNKRQERIRRDGILAPANPIPQIRGVLSLGDNLKLTVHI